MTYEQDWLNYQVESIEPVHESLTLGERWLRQMDNAAERYGLTLQYCMPMPRHLLAAVQLKVVTQVSQLYGVPQQAVRIARQAVYIVDISRSEARIEP